MPLIDSHIATATVTGFRATKARAYAAYQATAAGRIESTYDLGDAGQLVYVMEERRDNPNTFFDHWEHVLPLSGRQAFHSADRDVIALQLIEARVASVPRLIAQMQAARRAH